MEHPDETKPKSPKSQLKIDSDLIYLHDFKVHNAETAELVDAAKTEVASDWNSKYQLPDIKVLHRFSENVYKNYKAASVSEINPESPWRILYCVQGTLFFKLLDGFYAELYFNTENYYLMLVIKGTSSFGNKFTDLKNVVMQQQGGEIDSAFTFGEKVRELILQFKCKPMLIITGHSLGGYLAQIVTYTITNCFLDEDGTVQSREEPSDDFGIYTIVFDSPAAFKQISKIEPRDPVQFKKFRLPITNFVDEVNIINSNSKIGRHLGQVLAVKDFKKLGELSMLERIKNLKHHKLDNFQDIHVNECTKLEHLPSGRTVKFDAREIPALFFTLKNVERLQKYIFLAPMCAELMDKLPKFTLLNSNVILEDENMLVEEFIPRVHQFLSEFKNGLDSGIINGKQIVDMTLYHLWRAEMLQDHRNELILSKKWTDMVRNWPDGAKIGGFESYEEMRIFGCMIHNSIPRCFHYDYDKFLSLKSDAVNNFISTTEATLILIVKDGQLIDKQYIGRVKIIYLVIGSPEAAEEKPALNRSALDAKSENMLQETKLVFMGNEVRALDVFGDELIADLPIWRILNFHKDAVQTEKLFYCNQAIKSDDNKLEFKSATEFANALKNREHCGLIVISSDAGMGKSTALKQIAETLQKIIPHYFIVNINLFSLQNELSVATNTLKTKDAAINLIKNVSLADDEDDEILKNIFDFKVKSKQMVLLFDSLDEICPFYRETANNLIELLRETGLQVVVTTRPHEGKNLVGAEIFRLQLLNSWEKRFNFIKGIFESIGKHEPNNLSTMLSDKFGDVDDKFWGIPMSLVMAVSIYDAEQDLKVESKTNIYKEFLNKSIEDTLQYKIGIDRNKATSITFFMDETAKYNELIEILAICTIFFFGKIEDEYQEKIAANSEFINRFVVAKLFHGYDNYVSFLHKSYAEYLVARVFVQQLTVESQTPVLNNEQLKAILLDKEYCDIRKQICGILAASEPITMQLQPDVNKGEKQKVLQILISEDHFELFVSLKEHFQGTHDNYVLKKRFWGRGQNLLLDALQNARNEFVRELINDGANFENLLSTKFILHMAVNKGLCEEVQCYFESLKSNVNQTDKDGFVPLHYAASTGNMKIAEFLIANGAQVDLEENSDGIRPALYYAIKAKSVEVVQLLIESKADLTDALSWSAELNQKEIFDVLHAKIEDRLKNERLQKALSTAVNYGQLEMCKHLCGLGANRSETDENGDSYLHHAAAKGNLHCLEYFLEEQYVDIRNKNGETPLMKALNFKQASAVEWLLAKKANVNAIDAIENKSCLHYAVESNFILQPISALIDPQENLRLVAMLVDAGADIEHADNKGRTALFYAAREGNAVVLNHLLDNFADPTLTDNDGNTCLHFASKSKNFKCVNLLVNRLPVDCRNHKQETPLHWAAASLKNQKLYIGYSLLEQHADPNAQNSDGMTSLMIAISKGSVATDDRHHAQRRDLPFIAILVVAGADVNKKDNDGWTALFYASRNLNVDVVKYLLEKGADPNLTDHDGNTCLHVAKTWDAVRKATHSSSS